MEKNFPRGWLETMIGLAPKHAFKAIQQNEPAAQALRFVRSEAAGSRPDDFVVALSRFVFILAVSRRRDLRWSAEGHAGEWHYCIPREAARCLPQGACVAQSGVGDL